MTQARKNLRTRAEVLRRVRTLGKGGGYHLVVQIAIMTDNPREAQGEPAAHATHLGLPLGSV